MRIKICLRLSNEKVNALPSDYQDSLSMSIHEIIIESISKFAAIYPFEKSELPNPVKLPFTFSELIFSQSKIVADKLLISNPDFHFYLSFMPVKGIEALVPTIFQNRTFAIGNKKIKVECYVTDIQVETEPKFTEKMAFKAISPLVVCYRDHTANIYSEYMFPKGERYIELFLNEIAIKYAYFERINNLPRSRFEISVRTIEMLTKTTAKSIVFKAGTPEQIDVKSYFFDFIIQAPAEMQRVAYYSGFGEKNAFGFGCCDVI